jgi:hypothetical protein
VSTTCDHCSIGVHDPGRCISSKTSQKVANLANGVHECTFPSLVVGLEHTTELGTMWFGILSDMHQLVMGTEWEHQLEFAIMTTCEHKDQDADQGRLQN